VKETTFHKTNISYRGASLPPP